MIEVEGLTKTYQVVRKTAGLRASFFGLLSRQTESVHAVQAIDFSVSPGEIVGFLGPNGAGKTTTLKMLAGLLTPTSGKVSVAGLNPKQRPRALLDQISLVMGQKQQLIWDLPPIDTLELNRAVYNVSRRAYRETLTTLTEMLGLQSLLSKPTRQLSLGERMKCEIAAALIHRPKVLFLDEPTIGLDVTMQSQVRDFIRDYNQETGATILLTSHYMEDVQALCPRVILIHEGQLRYDGELQALAETIQPQKLVRIQFDASVALDAIENWIDKTSTVSATQSSDGDWQFLCPPDAVVDTVKNLLAHLAIVDLRVEDPPLESIMRRAFRRNTDRNERTHQARA